MRELLICRIAMRSFLACFLLNIFLGFTLNSFDETSEGEKLTLEQIRIDQGIFKLEIKKDYFLYNSKILYSDLILAKCSDFDPFLIAAVMKVESNFNPFAISSKGAVGLMQNIPGISTVYSGEALKNPNIAIEAGCDYLSHLKGIFHEDHIVLTAYNHGMGNVLKYSNLNTNYSRQTLNLRDQYERDFQIYFQLHYAHELIWSL